VHRANALCDEGSLQAEFVFLRDFFKQNGYNHRHIHRTLNRHAHLDQPDKPYSAAFLLFVGTIFNCISRVLARHNTISVGLTHMKLSSLLRPPTDHLGLKTAGVYKILCESGRIYIGQTGHSVDIRLKEHQRHIRPDHPEKSAIAECSIDHGHRIQFQNSCIIKTKSRYIDPIVRKAIEIELHC
jgi:hypothetical protein